MNKARDLDETARTWGELLVDRSGPCERCGTVTTDWMSFDGKTGRCKCNNCFQPNRRKAMEAYERSIRELKEGPAQLGAKSGSSKAG